MKKQLMSVMMVFGLFLTIGISKANAQIVGGIEANVPFAFHAGNAKFPAGKYNLRMLDGLDLTVMEISSADGRHTAVFQVREGQAKTDPAKTELIFNKYGDQYFLSQVFDAGNKDGSDVVESHYEKLMKKSGGTVEKHHVPGLRKSASGK
jgi:hypothetical protein